MENRQAAPTAIEHRFHLPIADEDSLREFVRLAWGVEIPDVQVCPNHATPWRAFADAYFARHRVTVWKASRGFGGKSFLLALLGLTEAVTLKADVNILGGSGEQSENVHKYARQFWNFTGAPSNLLASDPLKRETRLAWGNVIKALLASSRSVRGPHPQRLRLDECLIGDTMVSTPNGTIRLDSIRVGDIVYGWLRTCGLSPCVVQSSKCMGIRETKILTLEDGRGLTGTGSHKIKTSRGWKYIEDIRKGDYLCSISDKLHGMREAVLEKGTMESDRKKNRSLSQMLPKSGNEGGTDLSRMRKAQEGPIQDAPRMLQPGAEEKSIPLHRLRKATETARNEEMSPLLASTLEQGWNDKAHGVLQSNGAEKREALQGRVTVRGVVRCLGRLLRTASAYGKVYHRLLMRANYYRGSRRLLARQANSQGAGCSQERNIREARIQSSLFEDGQDASMVAVADVRDGPVASVYDIAVENAHTFLANGIIVHNCDEMDLSIFDAAMGQAMSKNGVSAQTVISSTHQHADGTMTEVLKRAAEKGWPVAEWCYRETEMGWLSSVEVEGKRQDVTAAMWSVEYDLQEPSPESRAIQPASVEAMFERSLGKFAGRNGELIEAEPPDGDGEYSTGADWAKKQDWTVIVTLNSNIQPTRVVAFERTGRLPWPVMVGKFDERLERYGGAGTHDGTGLGDVVGDHLASAATGFVMTGRARSDLLSNYIAAVERGEIEAPMIEFMYNEHKYASVDDVYGSGHLPDSIAAMALAWHGMDAGQVFPFGVA